MKKEDKEFLEEAMNEFCFSEIKRIKKILEILEEPEK